MSDTSEFFVSFGVPATTLGFLQAFRFEVCDQQHLYAFWQCLTGKLARLETARYTGHYVANPKLELNLQAKQCQQQIQALTAQLEQRNTMHQKGIAKLKDELQPEDNMMRAVFRDSGFADDVVKVNAVQILKQAGIDDVRSV